MSWWGNRRGWILFPTIILLCLLTACRKDEDIPHSDRDMVGVWVDANFSSDTLVITREAGGLVLLDNSMAYRSHPNREEIRTSYTWKIKLLPSGLNVAAYSGNWLTASSTHSFEWIVNKKKFEVESLSFRPYISCAGCKLSFEKVR